MLFAAVQSHFYAFHHKSEGILPEMLSLVIGRWQNFHNSTNDKICKVCAAKKIKKKN